MSRVSPEVEALTEEQAKTRLTALEHYLEPMNRIATYNLRGWAGQIDSHLQCSPIARGVRNYADYLDHKETGAL